MQQRTEEDLLNLFKDLFSLLQVKLHRVWATQITAMENNWHSTTLCLVNILIYFRRGAL
jgi:hypothetical protein